jgi:hypothetical protein
MRFLSVILATLLLTAMSGSAALARSFDVNEQFVAEFEIDAVDVDAETFKASLSGEAGPYGRVYLSYDFTSKQDLASMGEFTGFAWTQNGEEVVTATLQGVWVKSGTVFKLYTFDAVSNGKLNLAIGEIDFINKTARFDVSELKL